MVKFGLVGNNITHSISPEVHKFLFKIFEIEGDYQLFDLSSNKDELELEEVIKMVKTKKLKGLNVTTPYKREVIKYLDQLTDVAKTMNSVNTIYLKHNKLIGDNTDYDGLKYLIQYSNENINNQTVYILGTGGASQTAYYVVEKLGGKPILVSRTPGEVKVGKVIVNSISYDEVSVLPDFIINATPLGNPNNLDMTNLSDLQVQNKVVFDLNYKPKITKLMTQSNLPSYNGTLMLAAQAVYANVKWFNLVDYDQKRINFMINKVMEVLLNE